MSSNTVNRADGPALRGLEAKQVFVHCAEAPSQMLAMQRDDAGGWTVTTEPIQIRTGI